MWFWVSWPKEWFTSVCAYLVMLEIPKRGVLVRTVLQLINVRVTRYIVRINEVSLFSLMRRGENIPSVLGVPWWRTLYSLLLLGNGSGPKWLGSKDTLAREIWRPVQSLRATRTDAYDLILFTIVRSTKWHEWFWVGFWDRHYCWCGSWFLGRRNYLWFQSYDCRRRHFAFFIHICFSSIFLNI